MAKPSRNGAKKRPPIRSYGGQGFEPQGNPIEARAEREQEAVLPASAYPAPPSTDETDDPADLKMTAWLRHRYVEASTAARHGEAAVCDRLLHIMGGAAYQASQVDLSTLPGELADEVRAWIEDSREI